jgi:hypothetical protein
MDSLIDEKNHARPSHEALNTDTIKPDQETEAQAADRRMNEIANKAAGRGIQRQAQDDRDIFTK